MKQSTRTDLDRVMGIVDQVREGKPLDDLVEQSNLSKKTIARGLAALAGGRVLNYVETDSIIDSLVKTYGVRDCLEALAVYDVKMHGIRMHQEHIKKYGFDRCEFIGLVSCFSVESKQPEPTKKQCAAESFRQEKNCNLEDAAFLAMCAGDKKYAIDLYERIIVDPTRSFVERARIAEIEASSCALEVGDLEKRTEFYEAASDLYERAAKSGEKMPGEKEPEVVRKVISSLTEQEYDAHSLFLYAATCAEKAGDPERAMKLHGLADRSGKVFEVNFDQGEEEI